MLEVEMLDAGGNVVTGDNTILVTFAKTSGAGTVSGLGTVTTAGGVASKSITGALAGSITITASASSLISDSTVFGVVAGAADRLVFTSSTGVLASGNTRT